VTPVVVVNRLLPERTVSRGYRDVKCQTEAKWREGDGVLHRPFPRRQ